MNKFDMLNQQTRAWNNGISRNISPTTGGKYGTPEYWRNYWNNQTYKANNGQYSKHFY